VRFTSSHGVWSVDGAARRAPGRGAYLCSHACAERVRKHKRYAALALAAERVAWPDRSGLCERTAGVYDSRVPPLARSGAIRSNDMK
jgi:hypothetical protein